MFFAMPWVFFEMICVFRNFKIWVTIEVRVSLEHPLLQAATISLLQAAPNTLQQAANNPLLQTANIP